VAGLLVVLTDPSKLALARQLAETLDPTAGGAFVPLVPAGTTDPSTAPTAYWECWAWDIPQADLNQVDALIAGAIQAGAVGASDIHTYPWPTDSEAILVALGLQPPASAR